MPESELVDMNRLIWRRSSFTLSAPQMAKLLTLSPRESPAMLQRKPITTCCICNIILSVTKQSFKAKKLSSRIQNMTSLMVIFYIQSVAVRDFHQNTLNLTKSRLARVKEGPKTEALLHFQVRKFWIFAVYSCYLVAAVMGTNQTQISQLSRRWQTEYRDWANKWPHMAAATTARRLATFSELK